MKWMMWQGSQVIQECRVRYPGTKVILVNGGLTEAQTAAEATRLGAADYLTLPFEIEHLQRMIHRAIQKNAGTPGNGDLTK